MLAFLGFSSEAAVQGLGPIEALQKHLEDPGHNNSEWAQRCAILGLPAGSAAGAAGFAVCMAWWGMRALGLLLASSTATLPSCGRAYLVL